MEHAKLSPSSSSRWTVCTASVAACEQYENTTNTAAQWGTTVHGIGELMLKGKLVSLGETVEGLEVDKEMLECAEEYVDYCRSLMRKDSINLIEERFNLEFIAPNTFGTGDFSTVNDNHLDIVDLKTGRGVVYAENNTQLKLYALGAIHELETFGIEIETVTLHIVQTRINHIDTWDITVEELREFELFVKEQARRIREDEVSFNPDKKACEWCPHKHNCEALQKHVLDVVQGSFDNLDELEGNADIIDNSHLKKILDNADLITSFVKACQDIAVEKLQSGETIEGYKIVESRTNRKWEDESKVEAYLKKKKVKVDDMYDKKLKSMTKILKLRPNDEELEAMLIKPKGSPTLALNSDKRPALVSNVDCFENLD